MVAQGSNLQSNIHCHYCDNVNVPLCKVAAQSKPKGIFLSNLESDLHHVGIINGTYSSDIFMEENAESLHHCVKSINSRLLL